MVLILLEALAALVLLLLIVWWTMFSGRKNGELPAPPEAAPGPANAPTGKHSEAAADRDRPH